MNQQTVAENFQGFLDVIAKMFPDTPARFDGLMVVRFKKTFMGIFHPSRQSCTMNEAIEDGKLHEPLVSHNPPADPFYS